MTKRKAPPSETGINPKLAALAAKLDEAEAYARVMEAHQKGAVDWEVADDARDKVNAKISNLREKLANTTAANVDELRLKAHYADDEEVTNSIIRDLLALRPPRPRGIRP